MMDTTSIMSYVKANLTVNELRIVMAAVNTYGDGPLHNDQPHDVLTKENVINLDPFYAIHCLGRQYGSVIKDGMMVANPSDEHTKLHLAHESIVETIKDGCEFASVPEIV